MWMSGIEDEAEFDKLAQKMTLKGLGAKIKCPLLILAGEDDELSPIHYTYEFFKELQGPKRLLVFEGQRHSVPSPLAQRDLRIGSGIVWMGSRWIQRSSTLK